MTGVETIYPLSSQQQGFLFESLNEPDPGMHVEQIAYPLQTVLDIGSVERAWKWVQERHPVLRTAFSWKQQGEPLQIVLSDAKPIVKHQDLRGLPLAAQRGRVLAVLDEDRRRGYDLAQAPLARLAVLRTGETTHQLLWSCHHILMDGWSAGIVLGDLGTAYQALARGREPSAAPAGVYRDYVIWQRNQDLGAAERFWRNELRGWSDAGPLGVAEGGARPAQAAESVLYGDQQVQVPSRTTQALERLARERGLTLGTVVHGLWGLLVSRYGGMDDVVIGTTVSGRPPELPHVESTVGLFMATLPLRLRVDPAVGVYEWLGEVQARHADVQRHSYCTAGQIHGWSDVAAAHPLFESIVVVESYPGGRGADQETVGAGVAAGFAGARTRHVLALLVLPAAPMQLKMINDRRRVADDQATRALEHLRDLLAVVGEGDARVEALLRRITDEERLRVRVPPGPARSDARMSPRTDTERILAGLCAELLGLSDIGVDENFFALGGHSLLAGQLLARVRATFDIDLSLGPLFESPTVAALAATVEDALLQEIVALSDQEAERLLRGSMDDD